MSPYFQPVKHFGKFFDRGMCLYEFDALREPEKTQFPQIGIWLMERYKHHGFGIASFNKVQTPQMLWKGKFWPDLYISNQLDAVPEDMKTAENKVERSPKSSWTDEGTLEIYSKAHHGKDFHDAFIEPMCHKITGLQSSEISAKYNRSIWLPLYWPETLRSSQSIPTRFYYPKAGYAYAALDGFPITPGKPAVGFRSAQIALGYLVAKPRHEFSVLFVVDDSPIYRVTDMDVCAGIETDWHRLVVEGRGQINVMQELQRLGIAHEFQSLSFGAVSYPLPTIENVKSGWKPSPHMNAQILEHMNASTVA